MVASCVPLTPGLSERGRGRGFEDVDDDDDNIIITAVISIAPYLTDKGEHTALYKINHNVYIKTSKIINYIVVILYSSHTTYTHTHTHTHTHTYIYIYIRAHARTHARAYRR